MPVARRDPFLADWREQRLSFVYLLLRWEDHFILRIAFQLFHISGVVAGDGLDPSLGQRWARVAFDHGLGRLRQRVELLLVHQNTQRHNAEANEDGIIGDAIEPEVEERRQMRRRAADCAAADRFGYLRHRHADRHGTEGTQCRAFVFARRADRLAFEIGNRIHREVGVDRVWRRSPKPDYIEVAVVMQRFVRIHRAGDQGRLPQIPEQAGKFEDFGIGESAGRIGRDDPGKIGDAVEEHLWLLTGVAAERTVGEQVEYDSAVRFALHGFRERLHHGSERHLAVRCEDGPFEVVFGPRESVTKYCCGRQHRRRRKKASPVHLYPPYFIADQRDRGYARPQDYRICVNARGCRLWHGGAEIRRLRQVPAAQSPTSKSEDYPPILLSTVCRGMYPPHNGRCARVRAADTFQLSLLFHKCR